MDLWVVAAAAGAGYLVKHWQNIFKDNDESGLISERFYLDEPQSPSFIKRIHDTGKGDLSETSTNSTALNYEEGVRHDDGSESSQYVFSSKNQNDIYEDKAREMGDIHAFRRNKNSKRRRRLQFQSIKPRTSLDSCLMAQMDREHVELESYLLTPLSSPRTPSPRPFLIRDAFRNGLHKEVYPEVYNEVKRVPRPPQMSQVDYSKQKFNNKNQMGKSHMSSKLMQFHTLAGVSSGQALFCLGISIGIISTIIANTAELEKLERNLKQTENLVENLQDELEVKDSSSVKELVNHDDSQDTNLLIRYADEESASLKKDGSITNIEAELERLELSMERPMADGGSYGTPTPYSTKDGVSPHELSLRLHDVIQLRLEKWITELESELTHSQNHINHLISERSNYWREISNSGSSSSWYSPRPTEIPGSTEVFEELNKVNVPKDERSQIQVDGGNGFGKGEEAVPLSVTGIPSSEDSPNDFYNIDDDNDDDDMVLIRQIVEKARQGSPAILRAQKAMVLQN